MKRVSFYTLGCKVNAYDTESMRRLFEDNGYAVVDFGEKADIVVVNTCTVTSAADKKSRAAIRRAARTGKVIVAGCISQKDPKAALGIGGVSAAVGTDGRARIVEVAQRLLSGEDGIDATCPLYGCGYEELYAGPPSDRTRGIIKIQEGCGNYCSYCVIPYVRGMPRSREYESVMREARAMRDGGVKEIVLTGIHIASYRDKGRSLSDLITGLDELNARVRIGSIEPGVLGEEFVAAAARAKNFCPHFHVSLQSGSGSVLSRMNRKYTPEEYSEFLALLRRYFENPAVTTDVIAGFPGETDAEHEETKAFVESCAFSRIHVFPFSARKGTKAYGMEPKVPKNVIRERTAELLRIGDALERRYVEGLVGKDAEVLFEDESGSFPGCLEGYSERYVRVAAKAQKNELKKVKIIKAAGKTAYGEGEDKMSDCIFCKIVSGEIPSSKVHEDENVLAFHDIDKKAPVHILIVPKKHIASVSEVAESDMGIFAGLVGAAKKIAAQNGLEGGFRLVINDGADGGQTVAHLHVHLLGGRRMGWPPG